MICVQFFFAKGSAIKKNFQERQLATVVSQQIDKNE
jgi:hypothetical protein